LSYASPGYLPCFFQKSNITLELKCCQGKNAGTRVLSPIAPRPCSLAGLAAQRAGAPSVPPASRDAGTPVPSPAKSEFRLDLPASFGV